MTRRWYEPQENKSALGRLKALVQKLLQRIKKVKFKDKTPSLVSLKKIEKWEKIKARLYQWTLAFGHWFQLTVLPVLRRFDWKLIQGLAAVLVGSFFLANSMSTFAANGIMSLARTAGKSSLKKGAKLSPEQDADNIAPTGNTALGSPSSANTVLLKKEIIQRNIFNSDGKLAPEPVKDEQRTVGKDLTINFENISCSSEELPVQITGTIFASNPKNSLVILKDAKIAEADVYKPGDAIIDHEDYEIYKIERGSLQVRKGNTKICVALTGYSKSSEKTDVGADTASAPKKSGESKEFEFDAAFISQEIGPGYATILNCAKLIPDIDVAGKMQGFKMISIATSCLFDRIQIQNGDVLTEVNGVSLKDAGQGFKIYQSLQEERTTTINILRNGEPITRIVRVK